MYSDAPQGQKLLTLSLVAHDYAQHVKQYFLSTEACPSSNQTLSIAPNYYEFILNTEIKPYISNDKNVI
jgi:hypothetical protein